MAYPNILISGLPKSGKSTLIKELQKIYQVPVMGIGDILRARWKEQFPNGELPFETYWPNLPFESQVKINQDLKERIAQGEIIGDTRYPIIVENEKSFKLFVTASLETRVERVYNNPENTLSKSGIRKILLAREQDELKLGKQLTHDQDYDYRDPKHCHLYLRTDRLTVEEEVGLVLAGFTFWIHT